MHGLTVSEFGKYLVIKLVLANVVIIIMTTTIICYHNFGDILKRY